MSRIEVRNVFFHGSGDRAAIEMERGEHGEQVWKFHDMACWQYADRRGAED